MARKSPLLFSIALLALAAACSPSSKRRGSAGSSTAPIQTAVAAPDFTLVAVPPRTFERTIDGLRFTFPEAIDPASLVQGITWIVGEDDDVAPGSLFHALPGTMTLDPTGTTMTYRPDRGFRGQLEIAIFLTSGIRSKSGRPLTTSPLSAPLSLRSAEFDQVFEARLFCTSPRDEQIPGFDEGPATPAPAASRPDAFEVVRTSPANGSSDYVPTALYLDFSQPLAKASLTQSSVALYQMANGKPYAIPFQLVLQNGDARLAVVPVPGLQPGEDVIVVLTSAIQDTAGRPLASGAVSNLLTFKGSFAAEVFELRTRPLTVPSPVPATDPTVFKAVAGTDVWHVDFEARRAGVEEGLRQRGYLSGDAVTDSIVVARFQAAVLSNLARTYSPWKISFTAEAPAGTPGVTHSRIVVGGSSPKEGVAGGSFEDAGNKAKEDIAAADVGVFSSEIDGIRSTVKPALRAAERPYLDGTYVLGSGTFAEDERARDLRAGLDDYARAVAGFVALEIGHAVGLARVDARFEVMRPQASRAELSDPRRGFSASSVALLDANLGRSGQ